MTAAHFRDGSRRVISLGSERSSASTIVAAGWRIRRMPHADRLRQIARKDKGESMARTRIPLDPAYEQQRREEQLRQLHISEIGLPVRTTNGLENAGIFTVGNLVDCTPEDVLQIANFGHKTVEEIRRKLESVGLQF